MSEEIGRQAVHRVLTSSSRIRAANPVRRSSFLWPSEPPSFPSTGIATNDAVWQIHRLHENRNESTDTLRGSVPDITCSYWEFELLVSRRGCILDSGKQASSALTTLQRGWVGSSPFASARRITVNRTAIPLNHLLLVVIVQDFEGFEHHHSSIELDMDSTSDQYLLSAMEQEPTPRRNAVHVRW